MALLAALTDVEGREDAEVIRHVHRAGAAITNALRRSPKMQEMRFLNG